MKCSLSRVAITLLFGLVTAYAGCGAEPVHVAPEPPQSTNFTSTREVMSLQIIGDELWVATTGGVLRHDMQGKWQKWTRQDGLPSHEVQSVFESSRVVGVKTVTSQATWSNGLWQVVPPAENSSQSKPRRAFEAVHTRWKGREVYATLEGLKWQDKTKPHVVGLPQSHGTHISALLPREHTLWAAMFGDGLWQFDGENWKRAEVSVPAMAREITALSEDSKRKNLWVGTRRDGVWSYNFVNRKWAQFLQSDEPFNHNVQAFAAYEGKLYVSTLEDGLVAYGGKSWSHISQPQISTVAPRQIVVFNNTLYLRHGDGQVDSFNGKVWHRHLFADLPRGKVSMLFADGSKLYAAQWGGWSEWDGAKWTHCLNLPELQGLSIMSFYANDDRVWIGTQSKGLAEYSHLTKTLRWHDERHGLSDDWITCISQIGNNIYAGTFVGGLMRFDGKKWHEEKQLSGQNVTALEPDTRGGIYIATRNGTWHHDASRKMQKLSTNWLDSEAQALLHSQSGLWIGTRTGLFYVRNEKSAN